MAERIESIALARLATAKTSATDAELATALRRFAPGTQSEAAWRDHVASVRQHLVAAGALEDPLPALAQRIGAHERRTWVQYADRVFPALALGVSPGDGKAHARLADRDAWAAAIAARALGIWSTGLPPTAAAVCDAFAWRELGLGGKPKRCPPEVRALFFQRALATDPGPADRMLRLFAARAVDAARPELRALRDALVRGWLLGRTLGAAAAPAVPSFTEDVRDLAAVASDGVFGDRKVFIASVWNELRRRPAWSSLTLDDFKSRLVRAHRAGDLVLARADLVSSLNPELVSASEIQTDGASFHFIVRESP